MTTLTITVNGNKPGEQLFFVLNILKSNFFNVIEMNFNTVQDVLDGENKGIYSISR